MNLRWRIKAFLMCHQARRYRKFIRFRAIRRSLRQQKRRAPDSRGKAGIPISMPSGAGLACRSAIWISGAG